MEIIVPTLPESVDSAVISVLHVQEGESVKEGQILVELETSKVILEVTAVADGVISDLKVSLGDHVNSEQNLMNLMGENVTLYEESEAIVVNSEFYGFEEGIGKPSSKDESSSFGLWIIGLVLVVVIFFFASASLSAETIKPFTSDGCSAFPDGTFEQKDLWLSCCTAHDYAYWQGGTYEERFLADKALRQCVTKVGEPQIAKLMLAGVRVGGTPYFPTSFRWGYGWSYPRLYKALTEAEKKQIKMSIGISNQSFSNTIENKEYVMSAKGQFEVNLAPQNDANPAGRMLINKTYTGDLIGSGVGQMISKRTATGNAVYYAIEEFSGLLDGKSGSFTLVHNGSMNKESQSLSVVILDGSGDGELMEISGTMEIIQEGGSHSYVLDYTL